ncbi:MAG: hypothetical protein V4569_07975 [Pseudomonadota bacterium]
MAAIADQVVRSCKWLPPRRVSVIVVSSPPIRLTPLDQEQYVNALPTPMKTPLALQWLEAGDVRSERVKRALLSCIDGHRNVIELGSFAKAMGLMPDVLECLRVEGLIQLSD